MRNSPDLGFVSLQIVLMIFGLLATNYSTLIIIETFLILYITINKWGKGIVLREIISLHAVFVLLLMPLVGYNFYTVDNPLAKLWVKYMPVGEFEYYSFVFPATIIFTLILCWPTYNKHNIDVGQPFIQRLSDSTHKLRSSKVNPKFLILWSSGVYFLVPFLPSAFQYIGYLFFTSSFTGFLMLYLDVNAKYRILFMLLFICFILYVAISTTMFTIIVYMGLTLSSFLYLNLNLAFWKKLTWFVFIGIMVISLQSVKGSFRSYFNTNTDQNRVLYLGQLLVQEASKGYSDYSADRFFQFYVRGNQGFLVAKVMDYIPKRKEYDNGNYLKQAVFSSLIPRIFWPDKPMAGGRFTMEYFTGEKLVGSTSMNVSPVGEAYGSFGPVLGIFYMAVLALFIRGVYLWFIYLTNRIPFLIFWFPVVFFQLTYSMETDSLQIFNSLFKSGIFVFILYAISSSYFGIEKKSFLALN